MKIKNDLNDNIFSSHRLKQRYSSGLPIENGLDKGMANSASEYRSHAIFKGNEYNSNKAYINESNINNQINTTTRDCFSGRVSFQGAEQLTRIERIVKSKPFEYFAEMARKNSAVFEAFGALFITCGIRPLAIMAMPKKDVDKNRKAASHSIASGLVGYVFAKIAYNPFSAAMQKIENAIKAGDAQKYLGKFGEYLDKSKKEQLGSHLEQNYNCFNQLMTYGPKLLTASILAAATVGTMPYIDKYIIDKYIFKDNVNKDKEQPKIDAFEQYKYMSFKSTPNTSKVFQNFKGAMK